MVISLHRTGAGNYTGIFNKELKSRIDALIKDLKHTGTIDFILSNSTCTAVLSVQEQYLSNDNISEMIGGRFKVLGKVS